MITGVFLATLVYFGFQRLNYFNKEVSRLEGAQLAQTVLSSAALRLQQIYANESGCDPQALDLRLNQLPNITSVEDAASFAVAVPKGADGIATVETQNRCTTATGCRQLLVSVEGRAYLVTAAGVGAIASTEAAGTDCPRDATVRVAVTIDRTVYYRRVTLLNICTLLSCGGGASFEGVVADVSAAAGDTAACVTLPARKYGSIVTHIAAAVQVNVDDLRWARRYISTGAGAIGDTTYMTTIATSGNSACAAGTGRCVERACVPAFDLNLDRTNNEADLAIMEYYLRGFIPKLPVRDFLN